MAKRIGGARRKTRHKFSKSIRKKGKVSIREYLQNFKPGDKVSLSVEPSVHKGMYYRRFLSKIATVKSKKGRCYEVLIKDGKKTKTLIVHPVHVKKHLSKRSVS